MNEQIQILEKRLEKMESDFSNLKAQSEITRKKYILKDHLREAGAVHVRLLVSDFDLDKIEINADESIKNFNDLLIPVKEKYRELFINNRKGPR